jgi:subtilisin family serine protease
MRLLKACGLAALAAGLVVSAGIAQTSGTRAMGAPVDVKTISFGTVAFDPVRTSLPEADRYRTAGGKGLRFVQFDSAIRSDWLGDLGARGIRPLQYYPDDTYLVWSDADAARSLDGLANVRWQGEYRPEWKLEPGLHKRTGLIRNVGVHFYNDGDVDGILAALRANGARVLTHGPAQADHTFFDAWIEIDAAQLDALADLPQVVFLEYASPQPIFDDEMSSQILARNYDSNNVPQLGYLAWLQALGYDGTGVTWSIIDSGVDLTHPDFAGRIAGGFTYPGCPAGTGPGDDNPSGGHGTHVAGIVGGSGAAGFTDAQGFFYGIGMAPGVRFFAQNPICVGAVPWPPAGGWQILSKHALGGGAVGGNASWTSGESGGTTYTAGARAWDTIIRDGDFDTPVNEAFMMVFSAGNSGPNAGTLTAPKAAKNTIITGGTQNYRVSNNIDAIYNSSSRGPTQDGRFGITIATPGQQIASARRVAGASQCGTPIAGTSNTYAFCTGTSMAAPHASGAAVLLTDWWRDMNGGATPSPAMIKALLINGAKDVAGAPPSPNATEGWGRVDVPASMGLDFLGSEYDDQSFVFDAVGQVHEVTFGVAEAGKPVKVSLAWTDAPAAVAANPALVNNLDLEVDVGGTTYLGNVFTNGQSSAGGTADNRNNVENVFVADASGTVTIRIRATNLPGDGIPNSGGATDQDFALVCRNCVEGAGFALSATPSALSICAPEDAQFDIGVESVLGDTQPVTLSVSGQPAGTTAVFTTNPVIPTGTSALVIGNTGAAAPGAYELQLTGTSPDQTSTLTRALSITTAAATAPLLQSPADGANNVPYSPDFIWAAAPQAETYLFELAADEAFLDIVDQTTITGTSYATSVLLDSNATYYWRVTPNNACGIGGASVIFSFTTQPAPGDCSAGAVPTFVFAEDFSGGLGAFATTGSTGASTWSISTARPGPGSGGNAALAVDIATVSEQMLISPPVELPADQLPLTLQFSNDQEIEDESASACYDGAVLDISTDAGATWTQVPSSLLMTQPYTGPVSTAWSSPIAGLQAWCGDPEPWARSIVDLSGYAGQTVQFRWRMGTDSSTGRVPHGWYVDDIEVQSCVIDNSDDIVFVDGFEIATP